MFPEDAIHGFNFSRESIAPYLETVPDPGAVTWSPCADPDRFQNTEAAYLNILLYNYINDYSDHFPCHFRLSLGGKTMQIKHGDYRVSVFIV